MSWHFSRALAGEYLEGGSLDGRPSAASRLTPTPEAYYWPDKTTGHSRLSRFGMISAPLTASRGEALLMSYLAGFLAKTYPPPAAIAGITENAEGLGEKKAACGGRCVESLEKSAPSMSSSKTHLTSPTKVYTLSSKTCPRWGTMRRGECFQQPLSELAMYEKGYSYLPTPTAHNAKEGAYPAEYTRSTPTLATHAGGKINPEWTEWLMGWPVGWTDLKPLATDKFRAWLDSHGRHY